MAAGATYIPIATTTLGSGVASYTFGSISSAYTDLRLVMLIYSQNGYAPWVQFNGDTGTNYSLTQMFGSGSTTGSNRITNGTNIYLGEAFNTGFYPYFVDFQNYSNTTTYKTCLWRASTPLNYVQQGVGLWRNTAAISSIKIGVDVGTLVTGCTLSLYGIAAA
jgi:hypothetical protein